MQCLLKTNSCFDQVVHCVGPCAGSFLYPQHFQTFGHFTVWTSTYYVAHAVEYVYIFTDNKQVKVEIILMFKQWGENRYSSTIFLTALIMGISVRVIKLFYLTQVTFFTNAGEIFSIGWVGLRSTLINLIAYN